MSTSSITILRRLAMLSPLLLAACSEPPTTASTGPAPVAATTATTNRLSMRVDGVEWIADHDLFGAFHPPGYNRALLVAGGRGAKDASEQTLNINLFGIDGPGRYAIRSGDPNGNVAQLANYTPERFLAGSMMGYDLVVDVTVAQASPTHIEATFSGTLTGNDSVAMTIEEGRFVYRE